MGDYVPKEGTFNVFKVKAKKNPKQPDFDGDGILDGKEVSIALWERTTRKGDTYYSGTLSFTEKDDIPF